MHRDVFNMRCRVCHEELDEADLWVVKLSLERRMSGYTMPGGYEWNVHRECAMEVILYVP